MKDRGCLKSLVVIAGIDPRSSFSVVRMGCRVRACLRGAASA